MTSAVLYPACKHRRGAEDALPACGERRRVMDARSSRYHEAYAHWQRDPLAFWGEAAEAIHWFEKPKTVFDPKAGIYGRWFADGVCNTCFNAVDRHVDAGRGDQAAII